MALDLAQLAYESFDLGLAGVVLSQDNVSPGDYIKFLNEELTRHRDFLENILTIAVIFLTAVVAAAGSFFAFIGWKSLKDIRDSATGMFERQVKVLLERKGHDLDNKLVTFVTDYETKIAELERAHHSKISAIESEQAEKSRSFQDWLLRVQSSVSRTDTSHLKRKTTWELNILWVDDIPENNEAFSSYFKAQGMNITKVLDTDGAIGEIRRNEYDVVISDMGRPEGATAGLTLLGKLREFGGAPSKLIIFSSQRAARRHGDEARQLGAILVTSNPGELVDFITKLAEERA